MADRGPRLGDAAFRAQRDAMEHAQAALRKLAAQAHGEVLTHLLGAWEKREADQVPSAQELGGGVNASTRSQWVQSIAAPAADTQAASEALLRLEIAADAPTPAEQISARRMLQLQLLTRRNDPAPAQTWPQDTAKVLASPYDAATARRVQTVLKVLLKR
jgi:ATP-dependent RNA helicase SUPV3L1/SUV3